MSHKRTRHLRRPTQAELPRWLRPKLDREQVRDLSLVHYVNLDAIATGTADGGLLSDWAESVLAWSRVAELRQVALPEMDAQLQLMHGLLERFARTGRVLFTGPEYQVAKDGAALMDELARTTDRATAIEATEWAMRRVQQFHLESAATRHQAAPTAGAAALAQAPQGPQQP